ncbi:hypothetical protein LJC61_04985 [Ruminococcaceae bacterium OttesenSCG-928-A16]|nr:hypothetical protein [Ruminococcaceae bacterium OttesenSCG-928-A16]
MKKTIFSSFACFVAAVLVAAFIKPLGAIAVITAIVLAAAAGMLALSLLLSWCGKAVAPGKIFLRKLVCLLPFAVIGALTYFWGVPLVNNGLGFAAYVVLPAMVASSAGIFLLMNILYSLICSLVALMLRKFKNSN